MKKIICCIIIGILIISMILPIISNASNIEPILDNNIIENNIDVDGVIGKNEIVDNGEVVNNVIENEIVEDDTVIENEVIQDNITDNEIVEENNIIEDNEEFIDVVANNELGVKYSTHVQDIGWQEYVENGEQSGTTGRNLKIEAIKIELLNNISNINIKYATFVQGIGWQTPVSNGQVIGTTKKNLRMEAIKIWLESSNEYSVAYRTHIQDYGWQNWTYDGNISGVLGEDKKIEAIEIKIVPKVEDKLSVSYSSHVQDIGWQEEKQELDLSGTTGRNLKIEALKISLRNSNANMSIKYRVYVENIGWHEWRKNGELAGTTGHNLRVFGIRIQLDGTKEYSVYYRVHSQDIGWSNWKKNGEVAGNIADYKKIEAIQIKIVKEKNSISNSLGVEYYTYLQGSSSNENEIESNGKISGTTGQNRIIDAIQIELQNAPKNSHIKYKTHIQNIGWVDWSRDGQLSGMKDSNLKIEAIQIELEGMPDNTVEYKVHVQDIGWTDYYIDGEIAGTTGKNKKIEAIQIRIVPKYKRYFKGIDVSYWQGQIDFDRLANSNQIDYMITRIGWYSSSKQKLMVDTQFERNYREAKRKNIPLGAYVYSYATSVEEARREAQSVVEYLKNTNQTQYELPIFYDIENDNQIQLGKDTITRMCIEFCEVLKNAGFSVGVYSYSYWLENYMNLNSLPSDYSVWVAQYDKNHDGSLPENIYKYANKYDMWQYSSKGKVEGIDGDVDVNICYKKYF